MDARRASAAALVVAVALAGGYWVWRAYLRGDEAIIRERLDALAAEVNEGAADALGLVARAAKIGSFFTENVVVYLGEGTAPIEGRETVMGMAARLQPRTAAFTLALDDVNVRLTGEGTAEVDLTATFTRHEQEPGNSSIDAREFDVRLRKIEGKWLIERVDGVEPLNKR